MSIFSIFKCSFKLFCAKNYLKEHFLLIITVNYNYFLSITQVKRISSAVNLLKPTVQDVAEILQGVPAAFRRWTWEDKPRTKNGEVRKWHIDNEYHVQNMLYFLLSPIFPDLQDEEYTPSVGQKHPRADLLIPSLGLIIEVKFMRSGNKPQDMIGQIAEDSSLYLVNSSNYSQIVAFIWDNSCQSHEHHYMRNGLRDIRGIVEAVIVSRPGNLK